MKGLHDFIIKLEKPLNETFKTESGTELYGHADFSVDRLSNRIAVVESVPYFFDTEIKEGYEVMFEPTILYKQTYQGKKQDYTSYVDRDNMLFRITPNMIILYRKDKNTEWKGFGENVLVQPIKVEGTEIKSDFLIIPESTQEDKYKKERVILLYANTKIEEFGAKSGDEIIIDPKGGIKFWIDGVEHWWLLNRFIWAVQLPKTISYTKPTKENGAYDGAKFNIGLLDEAGRWPNPKLNGSFHWKNGKPDTEVEFIENE